MFNSLKNHFIPHPGNDHRPHFLRSKHVSYLVTAVIIVELLVFVAPTLGGLKSNFSQNGALVLPSVLSMLSNKERMESNLSTLKENPLLTLAASQKAADMAENGYFAHVSPAGKTPWYWLDQVGYAYDYAGENLAIDFSDSVDVTRAWMNSPTHKANIIKAAYTEMGTGIAEGMYQGHQTVFVVQVYAHPRMTAVPVVKAIAPVEKKQVLGAEIEPAPPKVPEATIIDTLATSPRHTMNLALGVLLGVALLACLLNLFIKPSIRHPDLITNSLVLIAFLIGLYMLNGFIAGDSVTLAADEQSTQTSLIEY